MTRLSDARWPELAGAARNRLIVPLGSLEQHGPHLPLDTDAVIAVAVSERVHEARPEDGLAPLIPLGSSGEHAAFPGTLSIGTPALRAFVVELVRDASRNWDEVLVVNGHGGNTEALEQAVETCAAEGRRLVVVDLTLAGMDAHAGRSETSIMLHLAPDRVRLDLAESGDTTPVDVLFPQLVRRGVRAVSPNGVLGDPAGATAEEGGRLLSGLVAKTLSAAGGGPADPARSW